MRVLFKTFSFVLLVHSIIYLGTSEDLLELGEEKEIDDWLYSKPILTPPTEWLREEKNMKILWAPSQLRLVFSFGFFSFHFPTIKIVQKKMAIDWEGGSDFNLTVPLSLLWRHCYVLHPKSFG
jgi:hypothetical protein